MGFGFLRALLMSGILVTPSNGMRQWSCGTPCHTLDTVHKGPVSQCAGPCVSMCRALFPQVKGVSNSHRTDQSTGQYRAPNTALCCCDFTRNSGILPHDRDSARSCNLAPGLPKSVRPTLLLQMADRHGLQQGQAQHTKLPNTLHEMCCISSQARASGCWVIKSVSDTAALPCSGMPAGEGKRPLLLSFAHLRDRC